MPQKVDPWLIFLDGSITLDDVEYQVFGNSELEEMFDEMLNECYDSTEIGFAVYDPSDILKNVDPVAYRIGKSEYAQALIEDGILCLDETLEDALYNAQSIVLASGAVVK
jgi:hypothetical protein